MKIFRTLKSLILQTDFFFSTEMLRYNAELQYKTLTGGIISLGIIITIIVGFASMILSTLDLSTISTTIQVVKNQDPTYSSISVTPDSDFRFALEIMGLNLSATKRYFDVTFEQWYWQNSNVTNTTRIPLQACTSQYFAGHEQITKKFEKIGAGNWLCPAQNLTMEIYGKYSSSYYSEYVAKVSVCNNTTDPQQPCATPQEIDNYMKISNSNYLYFTVYFTNTQINPDKKSYKQYYIEDKSYSIFGSNIGSQSYLYFTDYTVSTDYSIWPFTNQVDDKGVMVQNLATNHPFQKDPGYNVFVYFSFAKGTNSITYNRSVQKLSAVFSFMGGMIGAVSAVLFFVKVYTSLSYQFSIAFELFKPDKRKEEQEERQQLFSFNFINFLRYNAYVLLKKMGINIEWPGTIEYAKKCRSEILSQLDVKALIKRIIFIEHCLNYMIEDYQLDALQIKKPTRPEEIRMIRQKFQSVIDNDPECSEYASEFQTEIKVEVLEPVELSVNTPSNLMLPNDTRKSKKIVSFKFQNISGSQYKHEESAQSQGGEEIVVVDIQNIKDLQSCKQYQNESAQPHRRDMNPQRSRVHNQYELIKKRSTFLNKLKQNAEEGNEISNKIWRHLNQKYKDDLENAKK